MRNWNNCLFKSLLLTLTISSLALLPQVQAEETASPAGQTQADDPAPAQESTAPAVKKGTIPVPPYQGPLDKRLRLTGDWDGMRTIWAENGLQIYVDWYQSYLGGVSGGVNPRGLALERTKFILKGLTGSLKPQDYLDLRRARRAEKSNPELEYAGVLDYTVLLDTGAMGLWQGGVLTLHGETLYGDYANTETGALLPLAVRTALPLNEYPITTLTHANYTQHFAPEFSVQFGKLASFDLVGLPFASGNGTKDFMHYALQANPQFLASVPYSTLGLVIEIKPTDNIELRAVVLDNEGDPRRTGFDTVFNEGTTYGAAMTLNTTLFKKPGQHVFGATYSNDTFIKVTDIIDITWGVGSEGQNGGFGPSIEGLNREEDTWAAGWSGMQYLWHEEETKRGIALFGRFGLADPDTNAVEMFYSAGVWGRGPFKSRPKDEWGLAYFNADIGDIPKLLKISDEYGAELFYKFVVAPWFDITPNVQVINPAMEKADSLFAVGVRTNVRF